MRTNSKKSRTLLWRGRTEVLVELHSEYKILKFFGVIRHYTLPYAKPFEELQRCLTYHVCRGLRYLFPRVLWSPLDLPIDYSKSFFSFSILRRSYIVHRIYCLTPYLGYSIFLDSVLGLRPLGLPFLSIQHVSHSLPRRNVPCSFPCQR